MRAKDYLLQISKIDRMITNKIAEVEHWKSVAAGTGTYSDSDRVQSSGSKQKMADAVVRYVAIEEEINQAIDLLVDKKQEVITTIEQLNESEYDILHKVYVQGGTFQEVATDMDKSYSWVTSVHGRALSNLQRILNERKRSDK